MVTLTKLQYWFYREAVTLLCMGEQKRKQELL